jgi:AcrR family transcriptional regulator
MRLTREQSRQRTRERLIESAHQAIVRDGVMALSLRQLCEDAGFSQGAFYSNFASRDELVLMVMERHVHEEALALQKLSASTANASLDDALTILAERLAALSHQTQWSLLAIELQLFAQRDPAFAAAYNQCKAGYHSEFALIVSDIVERHGLSPVLPPVQIAIGLYALWSGLVVQGTVGGALPRDHVLLAFFRAAIGAPVGAPSEPQATSPVSRKRKPS